MLMTKQAKELEGKLKSSRGGEGVYIAGRNSG